MVQRNQRGYFTLPVTHLELHRIAQTHTDYELRRILWAEQGLVVAMPTDT